MFQPGSNVALPSKTPRSKRSLRTITCIALIALGFATRISAGELDLTKAVILLPAQPKPSEEKAAALLIEEVARRSWVQWRVVTKPSADDSPVIAFQRETRQAAGFRLQTVRRSTPARGTPFKSGWSPMTVSRSIRLRKQFPPRPLEFDIPHAATSNGSLSLKWFGTPGRGGNGRSNQVAEVWLMRKAGNPGR